jgi:hypothetical protein
MSKWFRKIWNDPVWSKVIAGLILAAGGALWASRTSWGTTLKTPLPLWIVIIVGAATFSLAVMLMFFRTYQFEPQIEVIDVSVTEVNRPMPLTFPLKCHVQFRNESDGCVDVRTSDYEPNTVTLKRFTLNVLQIDLEGWVPEPYATDRIAVLPGQTFRAWIGIDETKFSPASVKDLRGRMGTLRLIVNGKRLAFQL